MYDERIEELDKVAAKIHAEKRMLRQGSLTAQSPNPPSASENTARQACREKSPEEIIDELFTYHPVQSEAQQLRYGMVRDAAKALALQIWKACPFGADRTDAIRKLRECVMTANAAIALNGLSLR